MRKRIKYLSDISKGNIEQIDAKHEELNPPPKSHSKKHSLKETKETLIGDGLSKTTRINKLSNDGFKAILETAE